MALSLSNVILTWNARSILPRLPEFLGLLARFRPLLVGLSETWLTAAQRFSIPGYVVHRADRSAPRGGVALLVRSDVQHYFRLSPRHLPLETVAVRVTGVARPFTAVAVYLPPHRAFPRAALEALLGMDSSVLLFGDFNCRHVSWGCPCSDFRGRGLSDFISSWGLVLSAPRSPSFVPARTTHRPSVLDLFVSSPDVLLSPPWTWIGLDSDHLPVLAALTFPVTPDASTFRWDFRRADWKGFRRLLDASVDLSAVPSSPAALDRAVVRFQSSVLSAAEASIPRRPPWCARDRFPPQIRTILRSRDRARSRWQFTRSPADLAAYHHFRRCAKWAIELWSAQRQWERLRSLSFRRGSVWQHVRRMRASPRGLPPLLSGGRALESPSEQAFLLAESFHDTFRPFLPPPGQPGADLDAVVFLPAVAAPLPGHFVTSPREVARVIDCLSLAKSPGVDGIPVRLLRAFPRKAIIYLSLLITTLFRLHHFPVPWKRAVVVPIPRRGGDPSLPGGYRPISLLPFLSKVAERILLIRLRSEADRLSVLPDHQFGFRKKHCALHAVASVVDRVTAGFCARQHSVLLLLDLARAFDSVHHGSLVSKLRSLGFPEYLTALLHSFLSGRTFQVRVNRVLSPSFSVSAGVPQGSLLSPLLFALYVSDLPSLPGAHVFQYADDTAVLLSGPHAPTLAARAQVSLRSLGVYFQRWGIRPNPAKSELLFLSKRRASLPPPPTFLGHQLSWQPCGRYLGVFLDTSLLWHRHVSVMVGRAAGALRSVRPLLVSSCPLSLAVRVRLWQSLVLPVLFYGAAVWAYAPPSTHRPLLSAYHRGLRALLGSPVSASLALLYRSCGVSSPSDVIHTIAAAFYRRAARHRNPLVAALGAYDVLDPHPHRRVRDFLLAAIE
ncbi:hypothetical protein PR048_033781 [Dryococelus australis]|uniref:Reverse transcriptase domain-containing protein n=1 Tax=Dryococelus australis TaxID=614101 RepID=A0ABQ9FZ12_9NEOP|nr:hypothetical protein PR048_033781 [Dryococelus australis]